MAIRVAFRDVALIFKVGETEGEAVAADRFDKLVAEGSVVTLGEDVDNSEIVGVGVREGEGVIPFPDELSK